MRKLAAAGRLERVAQGRLPCAGAGRRGSWSLSEAIAWTARRGLISHESALDLLGLLELCDVNPPLIHLSVPRDYAPRRRGGAHYRVWRRNLDPADVIAVDGLPVVRPSEVGARLFVRA